MKKDFSKQYTRRAARATNKGQTLWRWVVMMAMVAVLFCGAFIGYQYKKDPQKYPYLDTYVQQTTNWIAAHRSHLRQDIVKVKRLAANKNTEQEEIHFEFYTALPNMQMNATVQAEPAQTGVAAKPTITAPVVATVASPANLDTQALEQDISAQINQGRYLLQLGVFRTQDSAARFQQSLADAGFQAKVITTEKKVFKVQMGPFTNKNQARLAQIDLEKKGFNGVMHRIEVS